MKIEPIDGGRLRVWLSQTEAEQWNLHTDRPDPKALRRAAGRLLRGAGRRPAGRLAAEMIPVEGGWVLLISPLLRPDGQHPMVVHLADADHLLELVGRWDRLIDGEDPYCALYETGEGYELAVYPVEPLTAAQVHLLMEYGTLIGQGEGVAAHAAEYGTLIGAGAGITGGGRRPPEPEDRRN